METTDESGQRRARKVTGLSLRPQPLFDRNDFQNAKNGFFPSFGAGLGAAAAAALVTALATGLIALYTSRQENGQ
ncbi:hypothetical protein [Massilia glaciei]|uniref:hypothetical protein n=1 Tax=Massilia glaciei TaxID=1524097 RepID=UPI0011B26309|nr:hypothetical protein [Massilia glaciei]